MALITAILLAAGASRRFGGDKLAQALPSGDTVAVQTCRHLLAASDEVVAVLRPHSEALAAQLQSIGARVVICPTADQGMGASLAFGVQNSPDAKGWLVALADMPWIQPATIGRVADALRFGATIAAPVWQGRRGHPVGFSSALRDELLGLRGDQGAKSILQSHSERIQLLDCNDPGVLQDIDLPADLALHCR